MDILQLIFLQLHNQQHIYIWLGELYTETKHNRPTNIKTAKNCHGAQGM